jgi:hypothetical protein
MRLTLKDLAATVLVAAIAVPYIGYLIRGDMPFIEDARGMSATGLVLALAAFLVMSWGDAFDRVSKVETAAAVAVLALGVVALIFAETAAAEGLLAAFMISIALIWVAKLVDHADFLHWHAPTGVAR